jgi:hypothetical protein
LSGPISVYAANETILIESRGEENPYLHIMPIAATLDIISHFNFWPTVDGDISSTWIPVHYSGKFGDLDELPKDEARRTNMNLECFLPDFPFAIHILTGEALLLKLGQHQLMLIADGDDRLTGTDMELPGVKTLKRSR